MKRIFLIILVGLSSGVLKSQSISLSAGLASDLNNPGKSFYFIPAEIQWRPFSNTSFSVNLNYDYGLNSRTTGDAYTVSSSMAPHIVVPATIKTNSVTVGIAFHIELYRLTPERDFELSLKPLAWCFQLFQVSYDRFDKDNYSILDQELSRKNSGLVSSFDLQYNFGNKKIVFSLQTSLYAKREAGTHYKYAAPARVMLGYDLKYNTQK